MPWLLFSNVYVAFCGAALTATSFMLLGMPMHLGPVTGLVFFCTLVIYNLDRLVEPHPGDSEHERWVERHRALLWGLTVSSAMVCMVLVCWLRLASVLSLVVAGLIALGYCVPAVRYRGRYRRLKALPGIKLVLIALVWTYATMGLPIIEAGSSDRAQIAALLGSRFFFIAAVALPFDLPDMQRDRQAGIVTLPTWLGVGAARRVCLLLVLLSALFAMAAPRPSAAALSISCVCLAALVTLMHDKRGVGYFMVALDGMLLLQAGLIWFFTDT